MGKIDGAFSLLVLFMKRSSALHPGATLQVGRGGILRQL